MENVSKALLMAAGVLIGILLLAMMVYLFSHGANMSETFDKKFSKEEIQAFNAEIEQYTIGKEILAQDIVSLANFVYNYNKQVENLESLSITLKVYENGSLKYAVDPKNPSPIPNSFLAGRNMTDFAFFLKKYTETDSLGNLRYTITLKEPVSYSETTGQINKIIYKITD